jgi:hypothetical protein
MAQAGLIGGIIGVAIAVIILSTVFISTVKNTNTTGWTTSETTLWGVLTIVAIVGLVVLVLHTFGIA